MAFSFNYNYLLIWGHVIKKVFYISFNPATRIVVSNLKGERHEDYVRHIFNDLLLGPNSTLNCFIEINKDDWYIGTETLEGYLIYNGTEKYIA